MSGKEGKRTERERLKRECLPCLVGVKVEVSSLGRRIILSHFLSFSLHSSLPLYLSQVITFTQAVPAISLLSNPLLFFLLRSPLSLSFSCWLEICEACSSAPASVNPLPKHLSNARNLEMLKKKTPRQQRQQLFLTLGSYWQEWPHLEMCVCVCLCVFHK